MTGLSRALTAAVLLLAVAAQPAAAAELDEYRAGLPADSAPSGIARGADGNVWFTDLGASDRIGRVTAAGEITMFTAGLTPNSGPTNITPGPDGNLWFTEAARAAIGRITPAGVISEFTAGITPGSEPHDIVAAPDGNLWFTERSGRIGRITPQGVVTEFSAGMPAGARPHGITVGADGNLWFTDASATAAIGQATISGTITIFDAAVPAGAAPYDIAPGADGNLWFTLPTQDKVGRITPGGAVTLFGGMRANAEPMGMALGPDGRVWFSERKGGRIAAVTSAGLVEEVPAALTGAEAPTEITTGPGGTVWFTEAGRGGAIGVFRGAGDVNSTAGLPDSTPGLPDSTPITPAAGAEPGGGAQTGAAITEALQALVGAAGEGADWTMPVQGKDFLVAPVAGEIRVRAPGARRSGLLKKLKNIPVGSRVDTSQGVIALVSGLPKRKYQLATFKDGRFDAKQSARGMGTVDLVLRGKTGCGGNGEPDPLLAKSSARRKAKPTGRRLWASDNRGRFRTHGRDSVATVRGTEWITEDNCDGTLTTVVKGAVQVRNRHTGRRVVVKAGRSHLVRRR